MQAIDPLQKQVHFIETPDALETGLKALSTQSSIAFDLEFDSHHYAYGVTLCLIQIASPDACYVIDPFASIDLAGVYALFEDERILKIVHSPGEDLRLLHSLQCFPRNLFDTEVVAKLLNYEQTSLATILQEKLGKSMNKQQQKSNWLRRPLSAEQRTYAALDVAWLHELKDLLEAEAQEKGLTHYVQEEQSILSKTIHKPEVKENFLKPADKYKLSPKEQYVLNALLVYRDQLARKINKPAFQVLSEDLVRALANGSMQPYDLLDESGLHRSFKNSRFADELADRIDALQDKAKVLQLSDKLPPREYFTPEQLAAREKANRDRTDKFVPIQQALAERFGTFAARLIFSTTAVNEVLSNAITISGLKHPYRSELVRSIAAELGIDLSDYE